MSTLAVTRTTLVAVLRDPARRDALAARLRVATSDGAWQHDDARIAAECVAAPDELAALLTSLHTPEHGYDVLITPLLHHPAIPEPVLLDLAVDPRYAALGERPGPRALLEYMAAVHHESGAIGTLAVTYYATEPIDVFTRFIATHQQDPVPPFRVLILHLLPPAYRAAAATMLRSQAAIADPPVRRRIVRNKAQCLRRGEIIESQHHHDYVACRCRAIAINGGRAYVRQIGAPTDIRDLTEYDPEPTDCQGRL